MTCSTKSLIYINLLLIAACLNLDSWWPESTAAYYKFAKLALTISWSAIAYRCYFRIKAEAHAEHANAAS